MKNPYLFYCMIAVLCCLAAVSAGCTSTGGDAAPETPATKTITDMVGRTLTVPQTIDRVLGTSPPGTIALFVLAPDKLGGLNFEPNKQNGSVYMSEKYRTLPVVGGWFGKQTGNYETFISMNPDILIHDDTWSSTFSETLTERQQKFGDIPVVGVRNSMSVTGYDSSIQFLGDLLGAEEQARSLSEYYNRVMTTVTSRVESIPDDQRARVYYAEGPKGLQTDPKGSSHSELVELAGGINVADCQVLPGMGMTPVSMEQVTKWNPDVIIVGDPGFYSAIWNDPLWQDIPAVKNHRVFLVPQSPFTWFDRPPGVNRIIGIPWTAKVFYPDLFADMDLVELTREFYSKFYHYDLTESEVNSLLDPALR